MAADSSIAAGIFLGKDAKIFGNGHGPGVGNGPNAATDPKMGSATAASQEQEDVRILSLICQLSAC